MSHPYQHAKSSVKSFGGRLEDYIDIHNWLDCTKAHMPDVRHRALRHHSFGIFECEQVFGLTITNADEVSVPVRVIAEKHVIEDLGFIPTPQDWLNEMKKAPWMANSKKLSIEVPQDRKIISNNES
tara:strand:+ start:895 stop:1272 length:378 start_codon:yes stop_codon:yes gene_type:complete